MVSGNERGSTLNELFLILLPNNNVPIERYLWVEVVNIVVGLVEEEEGEVCSISAEDAINLASAFVDVFPALYPVGAVWDVVERVCQQRAGHLLRHYPQPQQLTEGERGALKCYYPVHVANSSRQ